MKPLRLSDQREVKYLDQSEIRRFFDAIPADCPRDRLLFGFIYRYGMRASEACELTLDSIDLRRKEVRIHGAKRGLLRVYPIFPDLMPDLRAWLVEREEIGRAVPNLFTGLRGAIGRQHVWTLFKEYAKRGRVTLEPGKGVHSLRHSAAVHVLDAGGTSEDVRDLLRHRDSRSSDIYAQLSTKRRNQYLRQLQASRDIVKL